MSNFDKKNEKPRARKNSLEFLRELEAEKNSRKRNFKQKGPARSDYFNFNSRNRRKYVSTYVPEKQKKVHETFCRCRICDKTITAIAESFHDRTGEGYVHFDCAMEKIKVEYDIKYPQKLSYIGMGKFGVFEGRQKMGYVLKQTIEWESADSFHAMQAEVESLKE